MTEEQVKVLKGKKVRELAAIYNTIAKGKGLTMIRDFPNKDIGVAVVMQLIPDDADVEQLLKDSPELPAVQVRVKSDKPAKEKREKKVAVAAPKNEIGLREGSMRAMAWDFWRAKEGGKVGRNEVAREIYKEGDSAAARTAASQLLSALARTALVYGLSVEKTKEEDGEIYFTVSGEIKPPATSGANGAEAAEAAAADAGGDEGEPTGELTGDEATSDEGQPAEQAAI